MSLLDEIKNTNDLSVLLEAEKLIAKQINKTRKEKLIEARKQAKEIADQLGISVQELVSNSHNDSVRYVNPNNPSQTWSGRGKKPKWLIELLENGHSLDDLTA